MWKLGQSLRKAIESYPEDLRVAVMATGGLSHQVHGERAGFINEDWDNEFLELIEKTPSKLVNMRLAEYVMNGGMEGAEVIMWLIMRGALSDRVTLKHKTTYAPSVTNIATMILEDEGAPATEAEKEAYREHMGYHLAGLDKLEGTHPLTHARSQKAFRINSFLHDLIKPVHRERFKYDFDTLAAERGLTDDETALIKGRKWIEMIHYGVSFFMLEKMAAVIGVPNPAIYAAFRGETLDEFQKSRKVALTYGVGGGDKAKELDQA